jgi:hypothetical protein
MTIPKPRWAAEGEVPQILRAILTFGRPASEISRVRSQGAASATGRPAEQKFGYFADSIAATPRWWK